MSTVFPAIRAIGEGCGDRLFYLTAKTITRTVAEEAVSILKEKGLQFKAITLTAKEKCASSMSPNAIRSTARARKVILTGSTRRCTRC